MRLVLLVANMNTVTATLTMSVCVIMALLEALGTAVVKYNIIIIIVSVTHCTVVL